MNKVFENLIKKSGGRFYTENLMSNPVQVRKSVTLTEAELEKFAESIVKTTLDEVAEWAHYQGDRAWSDDYDRKWIELYFGFGV